MKTYFKALFKFYFRHLELIFWIFALIALASMNPEVQGVSLCPYTLITGSKCMGCGIGHAISWCLRGEIVKSFEAHFMGPFAVIIIALRLITIFKQMVKYQRNQHKNIEDHG